ncbi:putative F-box/LRR-repeat/kelch-repeat protein At1g11620 [Chenopodium quinoa]|uniref:putative F-box/LRR-repeat/kelch-repeat protein At1g11620 n=1 Tax=Chenopodium quinoa TaxID=63459 RepID=UPI000B7747E0|nr:putative F-box/LRR-repeat/kelch-repeat protein At1g11620 [Chenopodium quinoa]
MRAASNSLVIIQSGNTKTRNNVAWPEDMKLNPDLWTEIFLKLPVKTLVRLRDVCKSWRSVIDSPDFITAHCEHFKKNSDKNQLLLVERIGPLRLGFAGQVIRVVNKLTFEEISQITTVSENCKIWGVFDGLFLYQDYDATMHSKLKIWNPAVTKSWILPDPPRQLPHLLGHDDKFVLGFDPSSKDYKVIAFRRKEGVVVKKLSSKIAVYSRNLRLWKIKTVKVNEPFSYFAVLQNQHHFCQGAAHWIVSDGARNDGGFEYTHVLSFDFGIEEFQCVELPGMEMFKCLFVFGKSLAVFGISAERSRIWIMREDVGEVVREKPWVLCFEGASSLDAYAFFQQNKFAKITYDEYTGEFFVVASTNSETKLMSYNITSQQVMAFVTVVGNRKCCADSYVESLVTF